ncbi:MAG: hypothetical protein A2341_20355 [Deltaproteobacteria bacterium RIFOXYB12_FULL_58_9]|nr:MAG: hypothetical protein A2341_20355 [Deltaproteobacteria bacterium RIFOXYB12_FULL_58_9]
MDRARNVTATFALKTYTLTVTKSGTGTVISTSHAGISCGSDCDEAYDYGTSVTLSAQPGANHVFSAWSGGGCSGTGTCVVSLVTATMVSATFVPSYILWVSKTGNGASGGTVTSTPGGINCGDACMNSFAQGAQVTLTATTLNGFIFSNWSAPDCSIASTCVVNATANITVVARFLVSGSGYGGLRLEDGGARWGRLGVLYGGVWGTVYYHLFGPPSATVACRELGFAEGLPMFAPSGGSGPIWMDDVNCNGREANITQCPFEGWGVEYANHGGDMGVICCPSSCSLEYGGARIAEGGDHGRLEVLFVGDWGTVGSRYFDDKDAKVACVNMGYDDGYSIGTVVADGSGPVWMNRLECTGMETSLDDCDFGERYSFGDNPQDHPYDVGVHCCDGTCPNPYGGSRIDGGGSSGRLEVQYAGIWGTVNFWGFDDVDAHVACRENGYDTGTVLPEESVPDGSGPVWMANLRCAGYESGIGACPFGTEDRGTWGSTGYATHDNDIGVQCVGTYVPTYTIYVQTYGNGYVIGRDWNGQWPEILCGDYDGGYSCYDQCSVEVPEGTQYYFYTQAQGSHTYWGDDCGGFAAGQTCEITMERNTMYVSADFSCSSSCITCTW